MTAEECDRGRFGVASHSEAELIALLLDKAVNLPPHAVHEKAALPIITLDLAPDGAGKLGEQTPLPLGDPLPLKSLEGRNSEQEANHGFSGHTASPAALYERKGIETQRIKADQRCFQYFLVSRLRPETMDIHVAPMRDLG